MPIEMDREIVYTKTEVDRLLAEAKYEAVEESQEKVNRLIATAKEEAIEEAKEIDRISMARHNWTATLISMLLGFTTLALYVDGLLRLLGIIPPFMDIDVSIVDEVIKRVEEDILPYVSNYIPGI